jgi:hypothetical protein
MGTPSNDSNGQSAATAAAEPAGDHAGPNNNAASEAIPNTSKTPATQRIAFLSDSEFEEHLNNVAQIQKTQRSIRASRGWRRNLSQVIRDNMFGSGVREDSWTRTTKQKSVVKRLRLLQVFVLAACVFSSIVNISQHYGLGSHLSFWRVGVIQSETLPVTITERASGKFTVGIGLKGVSMSLSTEIHSRLWFPFQDVINSADPNTLKGCCYLFVEWTERSAVLEEMRRRGEGGALVIQWAAEAFASDALALGSVYQVSASMLDNLFPYLVALNVVAALLLFQRAWRPCAYVMGTLACLSVVVIVLWEGFVPIDTLLRFEEKTMVFYRGPGEVLTGYTAVWSLLCVFVCLHGERLEQQQHATTMLRQLQESAVVMFRRKCARRRSQISQVEAADILHTLRLLNTSEEMRTGHVDGYHVEEELCEAFTVTEFDLCKHIEFAVRKHANHTLQIVDNPALRKRFGL